MDHGKFGKAERTLLEAIQLNPDLGPAHNNLGLIYFGRRQLYEAAHAFMYRYEANLESELSSGQPGGPADEQAADELGNGSLAPPVNLVPPPAPAE